MPDKALYVLAQQLRKAALWKQLSDDELFAVQVPDGLCYCSVMGMRGEFLALAVYPGDKGLDSYRKIASPPDVFRSMLAQQEHMLCQDCIICSFDVKAGLSARDIAEVEATGLSFRGKNAFPVFRRYRPALYPWYIEDAAEEAVMGTALRAALEVSRRLGNGTWQQIHMLDGEAADGSLSGLGFTQGAPFDRSIPLLTEKADGSFAWSTIKLPPPLDVVYPAPALADELLIARLRKAPSTGEWAIVASHSPSPVAEGEADGEGHIDDPVTAPYFPALLLAVDQENGFVRCSAVAKEDAPGELVVALAKAMQEHGKPAKALVPDARTAALLSRAMHQIGVLVAWEENLPFLEEAEDSLFESLAGESQYEEIEDEISDMLDVVAALVENEQMPEDIRARIQAMYNAEELPPPLQDKLAGILGVTPERKQRIIPMPQAAGGSYVVSVSLGKGCYRHIQLSAGDTILDLHEAIQDAFDFDNDHLYAFFMDNRAWSHDVIVSPMERDGRQTADQYTMGSLGLQAGDAFKYVFDFGDVWMFQCKVLRKLEEETTAPRVIRSIGEAPPQYPEMEEEEDEEDEEDDWLYDAETLSRRYGELALPKKVQERLRQYIDALAHLNSLIPIQKVLDIYNQREAPISEADFLAFLEVLQHDDVYYSVCGQESWYENAVPSAPMDRELVADYLMDEEDYENLKALQYGKPYYLPEGEAMLRYADDDYFEKNAAYEAMRDFLRKGMKLSAKKAEGIAEEMQMHASMNETDMRIVVAEAERIGVLFVTQNQMKEFAARYAALLTDTRMPIHRGHTARELTQHKQVGRNEPCPCGSGKKYKKCCGREA